MTVALSIVMAFTPNPKYPKPVLRKSLRNDGESITLGGITGTLADGRPYYGDFWWLDNFVGLTYHFSQIDLENAPTEEIIELLVKSNQLRPITARTRKFIYNISPDTDEEGNKNWRVYVTLGLADRIIYLNPDGSTRSSCVLTVHGNDGGKPPLLEVLEDHVASVLEGQIVIQMLSSQTHEGRREMISSMSPSFMKFIQSLISNGKAI